MMGDNELKATAPETPEQLRVDLKTLCHLEPHSTARALVAGDPYILEQLALWRKRDKQLAAEKRAAIDAYYASRAKAAQSVKDRKSKAWPLDKQRGSRVDWLQFVPKDVAKAQVEWERQQTAVRMRRTNMEFRLIGEKLGVSPGRARQMMERANRSLVSPVERYYARRDTEPLGHVRYVVAALAASNASKRDWLMVATV